MARPAKHPLLVLLPCLLTACEQEPPAPVYTCLDGWVQERFAAPRPDYPLVWETEHLDIYAKDNITVCAGTAAELERHVAFIGETLGIEMRKHMPLYLSRDIPDECRGTLGCAYDDGVTFAAPTATYHELGHAVACQLNVFQAPVLSEGFAEAFIPRPRRLHGEPALYEALHASENYGPHVDDGVHFIRWVIENYGGEAVAEIYRTAPIHHPRLSPADGEGIIVAIEATLGSDFDTIEREFETDLPYMFPPFRQCADIPHVERGPEGEWHFTSIMDCDDESTFGPYERISPASGGFHNFGAMMHQGFTIDVPKTGKFAVEMHGVEAVRFERCGTEPAPTEADAWMFGEAVSFPTLGKRVKLRPGRWRVDAVRDYGDPAPVEVIIRKTIEDD
ncbi:MAG: hypothetical protein HC927_00765 [Deltaproteobacteria bacterium]|nr:hypothetical protein [Deltaproteobacteria bacterium]